MDDFLEAVIFIVIVIAIFVGGALALVNWHGNYTCSNYQQLTNKETKWKTLDECYVKTGEGWQRWDEYTNRAIASEGLKDSKVSRKPE